MFVSIRLGIPPILYLALNRTIRNETRELILNLLGINLNRLSEQSRAEVRRVAGMDRNGNNDEELVEATVNATGQQNVAFSHNQIVPAEIL